MVRLSRRNKTLKPLLFTMASPSAGCRAPIRSASPGHPERESEGAVEALTRAWRSLQARQTRQMQEVGRTGRHRVGFCTRLHTTKVGQTGSYALAVVLPKELGDGVGKGRQTECAYCKRGGGGGGRAGQVNKKRGQEGRGGQLGGGVKGGRGRRQDVPREPNEGRTEPQCEAVLKENETGEAEQETGIPGRQEEAEGGQQRLQEACQPTWRV